MTVSFICMKCLFESGVPTLSITEFQINDKGAYEYICEKGHRTLTITTSQKYEILFVQGLNALLDGYPDCAVTRFAVSLERFYEFYIKVMLLKQGLNLQDFEKMWKQMSQKSERQFGAFLVLYELDKLQNESGIFPVLIENKWIEFRNKVIHHGSIPSDEEARKYGRRIFDFIKGMSKYIIANYTEEINKMIINKLLEVKDQHKINKNVSTMSEYSFFSDDTFEKSLERLKECRMRIRS